MPNRLAYETSPYLLQHKDNPVDWHAWGEEALSKAREQDKPILLSIGYSACHWCHVMEHESFEDQETADVMNELYVSIKVDREERPDLDNIYMQAVQALTGRGGWPMTVFLTPDGRPFYGGTYYPNEPRQGMPGFKDVLRSVSEAYHTKRDEVLTTATSLVSRLADVGTGGDKEMLTDAVLQQAVQKIAGSFDWNHGGLDGAPKFPQPMTMEFLLRSNHRQPDPRVLQMVELSLTNMARGGMYDQLGGGFHRYSVDAHWLVPHFEKMLYDNALLSQLYLHAYQATKKPFYRRVAEETLDYVLREMTDPAGGFYSTQDADSEGEEGKFFVWTPAQVSEVLGEDKAAAFNAYFDVTEEGNFEGSNILNVPEEPVAVARRLGIAEEDLALIVQRGRKKLYQAREKRVHPGRDEKVLTSWNGMMLRSFAEAGAILERDDYLEAAIDNAEFLLTGLRRDGRVLRTWKAGDAKLLGFLEDYALLIDGLLALHEATFDFRWYDEARALADAMTALFWDEAEGVFYDTGNDAEKLIVRPRDFFDNAMPCGGSAAALALLRLAVLRGEPEYNRMAARTIRTVAPYLTNYPTGFGNWLGALDFYLSRTQEIAVVGARGDRTTASLIETVFGRYLPNKVVTGYDPGSGDPPEAMPLLAERGLVDGAPAAYVCENYACQLPAVDAETLAKQLGADVA